MINERVIRGLLLTSSSKLGEEEWQRVLEVGILFNKHFISFYEEMIMMS